MRSARRYLAWAGSVMGWMAIAVVAWFLWPATLGGGTSLVVVSGDSMETAYSSGDLVFAREGTPQVGDVIVYNPEGFGRAQIVHRVIGGDSSGWIVQGDNNDFIDPFEPTNDAVVGVVKLHIGGIGWLTALLLNPYTWAFVILAALVLLLWFSSGREDDEDDDDDEYGDGGFDEDAEAEADAEPADAGYVGWTVGLVLALAGILAFVFSTPASASNLAISSADTFAQLGIVNCAQGASVTATVHGTPTGTTYGAVQVGNVPAACAGQPMEVRLLNSSGTQLAIGSTTAATGTVNVSTSTTYNATNVASASVRFLWTVPTAWSYTPPPPPSAATCVPTDVNGNPVSGTCTVTNVSITDSWGTPGNRAANATFRATSSSGWFRVTFNFSQAPFPGWNPHSISGNLILPPSTTCSALPLVTVRGPSWSNSQSPTYNYYFGFAEANGNICP